MTALVLEAPAKVNLWLRVLGRRADGYHDIETCMHALALHDLVYVEPRTRGGIELQVRAGAGSGHAVPANEDNLVHRAARAFFVHTGIDAAVRLRLEKRVPAGGGLGGGSSDAAATLLLLNALHGAPLDATTLHTLAARLGADVPFFLRGGTQLARGIGEQLETIAHAPHVHVLLILPPFGTSTAAVYENWRAQLTEASGPARFPAGKILAYKGLAVPHGCLPNGFCNDLEPPAMALHPELDRLRRRILERGYPVQMSGSGSTLFIAFADAQAGEADAAVHELAPLRQEGVVLVRTQSDRNLDRVPRSVPWPDDAP